MISRRFAARTLGVFAVLVLASCFGESTGPGDVRRARFALMPVFESQALSIVPIDRVHIVLHHADNSLALDTTIAFPVNTDTLDIRLEVLIRGAIERLGLDLAILDLSGTIVFQASTSIDASTSGGGGTPVPIPMIYVGPGANATGVRFVATPSQVFFGDTVLFTAEAVDANNVVVPTAPIAWSSSDTTRAKVPSKDQGRLVGGSARGSATVTASLLRTSTTQAPPSVNRPLLVQPKPNQIAVQAGNNQQGPVGAVLTQPVIARVRAIDNLGVQGVLVTFAVTSGGGSLSSPTATTDVNGDASVNWTLGSTLGLQAVTATAAGVSGSSANFSATGQVGVASRLAFVGQPSSAAANIAISPAVTVEIQDAFGNRVTTSTANVTLTLGANPGSATLSGGTAAAVAGVATFGNLRLNNPGTGYTLVAAATGLTSATSNAFNVTGGVPTQLGFTVQPTNATAGVAIAPAIQVAIQDVNGNTVTSASGTITLAIAANPGSGTLSGTASAATTGGVATFSTISINKSGNGYTLSATATGLTAATSAIFNISAATATQLAFTTQPPATVAQNAPFAVAVSAQDAFGNTVPGFTGNVTVSITTNPALGTLSGTTTVAAVSGTATFANLAIDNFGIGYRLGATSGVLTAATSNLFDVGIPPSFNQWINPAGGNWSNGANWSKGTPPSANDTVAIALAGNYTVTLDTTYTGRLILLGGASGTQTLSLSNRTLTLSNALSIAANGAVVLTSAAVAGPGRLSNGGLLLVRGSSSVNGALTTAAGSTLQMEGNGTQGTGSLTVATGFTNLGAIDLTSVGSGFPAQLLVTAGTLTNASGGTITASAGVGGGRALGAELSNQGLVTVSAPLALSQTSAAHSNSGTIDISGADLVLSQGGTAPSFANTGTVTIGTGRTWSISGGALNQTAGSIGGSGTLSLNAVTASFTTNLTNATTALVIVSSVINGPGTLINATGQSLVLLSSTVNAALTNQGLLLVRGSSSVNGALTTAAGSTLQMEGNGTQGTGSLTVATGFTNLGAIDLTSVGSGFPAQLLVTAGTLTNASGGTITASAGVGGGRTLGAELSNQGLVTLNAPLTLGRTGAAHSNSGTIDVSGADLTLSQPGSAASFSNAGTVTLGAGRTWAVNSGALIQTGGTIGGPGTFSLNSVTASFTTNLTNATTALVIVSSVINGPGTLINATGQSLVLLSSTVNAALTNQGTLLVRGSSTVNGAVTTAAGSTLRVEGNGTQGTGVLTVANGFTNLGAIDLTSVGSGFPAQLLVTAGTLTNASGGTITASAGVGGGRTLGAELNNQGLVTLNAPLTLGRTDAAHSNSGTIDVSGADLTVNQPGSAASFSNAGTVTIGATRTWTINGGALTQSGGTLGGAGTLSLSSVTGNFTTPFTNATTTLVLTSTTLNGPGSLTNAPGRTLVLLSSTIGANMAFDNQGLAIVRGSSFINGTLTTTAGSTLQMEGNGTQGTGVLTVAGGFTNVAAIELTSAGSGFPAQLIVTGVLTNAATGTITALPGVGGGRSLNAELDNAGTIAVLAPLSYTNNTNAASGTNGTLDVSGADLTMSQSGVAAFTFAGTVTIAAGRTLSLAGGTAIMNVGSIGGTGTFVLSSVAASFNPNFSTATIAFQVIGSTLDGLNTITNTSGNTMVLTGSTLSGTLTLANLGLLVVRGSSAVNGTLQTAAGSTIQVEGNGSLGTGVLTVAGGFANTGTIELTSAGSGFPSQFTVTSGTVTNTSTGVIKSLPGAGGPRTFNATLNNQGLVSALVTTTIAKFVDNTGTLTAQTGNLQLSAGGNLANALNSSGGGAIELSGGDFNLTGDVFVNGDLLMSNSGTLEGFGGRSVTVTGNLTTTGNGTVSMVGTDSLEIRGNASWNGRTFISGGTIVIGGNFTQAGATNAFRPTGGKVLFNGAGAQTVYFTSPGPSFFFDVKMDPNKTVAMPVVLLTDAHVHGTVDFAGSAALLQGPGMTLTLHNGSIPDFGGNFQVSNLTVRGQPSALPDLVGGNLQLDSGAITLPNAVVVGGNVVITGTGATAAVVDATSPAGGFTAAGDLLVSGDGVMNMGYPAGVTVLGNATFSSNVPNTGLIEGALQIGGNFVQSGHAESFSAGTNHQVSFTGTGAHTIQFASPGSGAGSSHFQRVDFFASGGTYTLLSNVFTADLSINNGVVTGAARLVTNGSVVFAGGTGVGLSTRSFTLGSNSLSNGGIPYGVDTTVFSGTSQGITSSLAYNHVLVSGTADWLNGPSTIPGSLVISGSLDMDDGTLTTGGDLVTTGSGVLQMLFGETITVNGNASFGGGDETGSLVSGTITVKGNFRQIGTGPSFTSTNLMVDFNGSTQQDIQFDTPLLNPSGSHFGQMRVRPGTGVRLLSDVAAIRLTTPGSGFAPVTSTNRQILVGDFAVDGLTLTNTRLNLQSPNGIPIAQLDNVTFQNMSTGSTQLSLVKDGVSTQTFNNITFDTTPASTTFILANALTTGGLEIRLINPLPATGGSQVVRINGANVYIGAGGTTNW